MGDGVSLVGGSSQEWPGRTYNEYFCKERAFQRHSFKNELLGRIACPNEGQMDQFEEAADMELPRGDLWPCTPQRVMAATSASLWTPNPNQRLKAERDCPGFSQGCTTESQNYSDWRKTSRLSIPTINMVQHKCCAPPSVLEPKGHELD